MRRRVTGIAACAAIALFAGPANAGSGDAAAAKQPVNCGSYGSFSIYSTAEVLVLRGIKCKRAREVAIPFDRNGKQIGGFRCSLAKNDLPVLFSCGKGAKKGNIRKFPQALIVRGVGSPRPNPSAR